MQISGIQVSEREYKCARLLARHYSNDANCLFFRYIASETGLEIQQARRAVRSLARKGLATYTRGLFDDDGMVAGSGYCATQKCGYAFSFCSNCEENESVINDLCSSCQEEEDEHNKKYAKNNKNKRESS